MKDEDDRPDVEAALWRIAEASSSPPPWRDALARLSAQTTGADRTGAVSTSESTAMERLALYQAVRDSGWLTDDEGFYLVSVIVEEMADAEAETQLRDLDRRLEELEESFVSGDPDGSHVSAKPNDDSLHEHEEASRQYQEAWDAIFLSKLASAGERAVADLYAADREEFAYRYDLGLQSLSQLVAEDNISSDDLCHAASCLDPPRADLARQALTEAGIPSSPGNATLLSWYWHYSNATGGVTIDVRRGDVRRARNVLAAAHAGSGEKRPAWTCSVCGQRISGEWQTCWQCGASPGGAAEAGAESEIAAPPLVDADATSMRAFSFHKILGAGAIVIFILIPLATGHVVPALYLAPLVLLMVFMLTRLDLPTEPPAQAEANPPATEADSAIVLDDFSSRQTTIRNATVRRAWQAAMIACFGFPPLGFYSLGLLWNLGGRHLPLHRADRWRTRAAYVLSIVSIILSLFLCLAIGQMVWMFFQSLFAAGSTR